MLYVSKVYFIQVSFADNVNNFIRSREILFQPMKEKYFYMMKQIICRFGCVWFGGCCMDNLFEYKSYCNVVDSIRNIQTITFLQET